MTGINIEGEGSNSLSLFSALSFDYYYSKNFKKVIDTFETVIYNKLCQQELQLIRLLSHNRATSSGGASLKEYHTQKTD